MEYVYVYITLACVFGLFMAWGIGANDVANAISTSVGSRALTIGQAILIAAVFEFAGAYLAGGEVTDTIRKGMINTDLLEGRGDMLANGMLAALLAAGTWLLVASWFGWPVSTTHSIVGAIVGFAVYALGMEAVYWPKVGSIAASWVVSPMLAGTVSLALFFSVQKLVLDTADPFRAAIRWVPVYIALTGFIIALVTLLKGLKHVGLELSAVESYGVAGAFGALLGIGGGVAVRRIRFDPGLDKDFHYANVERVFGVLMIITACAMAFAHGSNDVANAVGPVAAVVSVIQSGGGIDETALVPAWVLLLGAVGIVIGLLTMGRRVIATVGSRITDLTPSRGFAATLAAAAVVVVASGTGLPISTTHTLVGAVLGVGLARGIAALNLSVVRTIFLSWIVTLPAGALLTVVFYTVLDALL